ncbi:MAG: hypothetical protein DRJ69_04495 [Thermoprotei archaeon]|nr:MAG: hypothetical protein DRJ69_04495 [Thermoprotei archaeon]
MIFIVIFGLAYASLLYMQDRYARYVNSMVEAVDDEVARMSEDLYVGYLASSPTDVELTLVNKGPVYVIVHHA